MKINRWEEYQSFFQLVILKYLVIWFTIVPVIAGVVTQFPDSIPIEISSVEYNIQLKMPFYWQVLWLSSLFFVVALGIYKFFCPKFVQKYNNFSEYKSYSNHPRWLAWEAHKLLKIADDKQKSKFVKRFKHKDYLEEITDGCGKSICDEPIVDTKQTYITFMHDNVEYKFGMPILGKENDSESEKDVFYEIFGRYSESRCFSRLMIRILLILSLILFLGVLAQHIYTGFLYFFDWLLNYWHEL